MGVELGGGPRRPYHNKWINLLLFVGMAAALVGAFLLGQARLDDPYSSDGRFHKCGLVTEDGVTENLAAYWERCPDQRP